MLPEVCRIPLSDAVTRIRLLDEGWREIEVLETWQGPAPQLNSECSETLMFGGGFPDEMADLAAASFKYDRLHADPLVPKAEADEAKRRWVREAKGTITAASLLSGELAGFLIWKRAKVSGKSVLVIDLLVVAEKFRRHGVAFALLAFVAQSTRLRLIRAGTQSTNAPARAFYKSLGMKVVKRQRTFHR